MKQFVIFVGVLLILFVSCSTEVVDKGVVANNQELSDSSRVIFASQEFQASFSDFARQVSPIFKGKVHTRTNDDGTVEQYADLDSTSLSVANVQLENWIM